MSTTTPFLKRFIEREESAGLFLLAATAIALCWANMPWGATYEGLWESFAGFFWGEARYGLSLRHIVNDILMVLFFLVVGCELKRERLEGELSSLPQIRLPLLAALGGMVVPALVFVGVMFSLGGEASGLRGWAIPTATDIAFALGIFAFLGLRAPSSLRTFLLALAIIDDLGAVILIGLFYSSNIQPMAMLAAAVLLLGLWGLNKRGVTSFLPYGILGVLLWVAVHHSGVHATLAGLFLAAFLPLRGAAAGTQPLLKKVEKGLHPWVSFVILPIFALANAGVSLEGATLENFTHPLLIAVAAGLFFGKQIGVFGATWLAIKAGLSPKPRGASWAQIYGVALLCGIGFTMSLFISLLAFEGTGFADETRLGILIGSGLSAIVGFSVLWVTGKKS